MRVLLLFLGLIIYRFLLNLYKYKRSEYFLQRYNSWFKTKDWELVQYQKEVVELFKKAEIEDSSFPVVEPVGYGQMISTTTSVFLNFPSQNQQCATLLIGSFHKAIGVYRRRMWQSLNPLWWLEYLIFLPVHFFRYLGVTTEAIFTKIIQLIYWIIGATITLTLSLYPELVKNKLHDLLGFIK